MASVVMGHVLDLSSSGRTAIDWVVIALVAGAILWNVVQLGRRLYRFYGSKAVWHLQVTVLLWVVGLIIRPQADGSWKNWLGWGFLILALANTIALGIVKDRANGTTARSGKRDHMCDVG